MTDQKMIDEAREHAQQLDDARYVLPLAATRIRVLLTEVEAQNRQIDAANNLARVLCERLRMSAGLPSEVYEALKAYEALK